MLEINNLHVQLHENTILKNLTLNIKENEIHVIMGPNGSGKSTLTKVLSGHKDYVITKGSIHYKKKDLTEWDIQERACEGIFVAFQYPIEIPGVNNAYFLRSAYNAIQKYHHQPEMDAFDFMKILKDKMQHLKLDEKFLNRSLNEGFSGGEKKKNEILQLQILDPKLAILDETDSGLDIDALKIVADGINKYKSKNNALLLITHYQRLLDYIQPDYIHVLIDGEIIQTGNKDLAKELEKKGYDWLY